MKNHNLSKEVINAEKKDALYAQARSWICFRYDYSTGIPKKRDTLIYKNFYNDLFKVFPINDQDALVSREYIDYISNVKDVFSKNESFGSQVNFIKKTNLFSEKEMKLLEGAYNKDTTVYNSAEFKKFMTSENFKLLNDLDRKYLFRNVLLSCKTVPPGIGRDLIISQGLCDFYFTKTFIEPTEKEWESMEELIDSKFCINYIRDIEKNIKLKISENNSLDEIPINVRKAAADLNNNLIGKYKGNVVYIDFWATWCVPCRKEIPDSKILIDQFKDKKVVFLSLCCKSKEQDWKNTMAQEKLQGVNEFIQDSEFDLLAAIYKVKGFPTYILIDKNGKVMNYSAPRPSSKMIIINEIQKILD